MVERDQNQWSKELPDQNWGVNVLLDQNGGEGSKSVLKRITRAKLGSKCTIRSEWWGIKEL